MTLVSDICQQLVSLTSQSSKNRENIDNFYIKSDLTDYAENILRSLAETIDSKEKRSCFIINIDEECVQLSELHDYLNSHSHCCEFELTFDKKRFIQGVCSGAGDIDEILYMSVEAFRAASDALGLSNSLIESAINNRNNTRIHVLGLSEKFGGPKLSVIPLDTEIDSDDWLSGSKLPSSEVILKHVHLVSAENISVNPQQFELTWGSIGCEEAAPFRAAFAKQLLVALCTNYYSDNKVELKGVKHVAAKILSDGIKIEESMLSNLTQSIQWCYSKEDPDVPLQLVVDRLSFECISENLMELKPKALRYALEQAKSNYRFVIAKRSDDYRKELKEIYSDIQTVTDKFADKTLLIASELLKSLLTIGFIFTVGTVSKAVVNNQLLHSPEGQVLFKVVSIFLILSFLIRWLNASADLKISEKALKSWSGKLHSHISREEINTLIKSRTFWSKAFYLFSLAVVTTIQISIAYTAFYSGDTLRLLNL
ncbi:hypothetical protein [Pseudoalteromonas tetraodonis]|uniref:hypothetical protein n=1 Tax=Pseudoalteromonas tetraodonis TaxID=43659 RepID=UPI000B66B567|nr:hypothetical protein [Pseudoalteromonadaceae bacterium]OUX89922.1 MAG: hypothetical protein CBC03_06335 [Pseudoalteromonas sp. TMED43]